MRAAVLLFAASACTPADSPVREVSDGDAAAFAAEVQPVLGRHCAFLGCHGREGMALTLYAVDYLRLRDPEGFVDPEVPPLDETALSPAEMAHNRRAIAARAEGGDPFGSTFVRKQLDPDDGGIPHAQVVVFDRRDHPDLATLVHWLATVQR
jgi:hypothetical protein